MPNWEVASIGYRELTGLRPIGRGSFGSVYTATYLGIQVAIKEVRPSKSYNVSKYFERECQLLSTCRHPNIVAFMGLCRVPKTLSILIITEYVPNGNLKMLLMYESKRKSPTLSWRIKISLATDAARAIAYLHSRDIIHRDLKGENMLITENYRLKICDFGFARKKAMDALEMKRISHCGTEGYFAPEMLSNAEYGTAVDVFSLGCILCEIVCGRFMGDAKLKRLGPRGEISADIVRELALPECPLAFVDLALLCCSIKPENRPTMKAVLKVLLKLEDELIALDVAQQTQPSHFLESKKTVSSSTDDDSDSDSDDALHSALSHLSTIAVEEGQSRRGVSETSQPISGESHSSVTSSEQEEDNESTMTIRDHGTDGRTEGTHQFILVPLPESGDDQTAPRIPLWRLTVDVLSKPTPPRCIHCTGHCLPTRPHFRCDGCEATLHLQCKNHFEISQSICCHRPPKGPPDHVARAVAVPRWRQALSMPTGHSPSPQRTLHVISSESN